METVEKEHPQSSFKRSALVLNCLTFLIILCIACIACGSLLTFSNPYMPWNPFPPPTSTPIGLEATLVTYTPTPLYPPTWTPTNSPMPTDTETPSPTPELVETPVETIVPPTATITSTEPTGGYPFDVREGSPVAISNIYHPELGCDWMGVGGQVVDMSGGPLTGLIIRLGGKLPGVTIPDHLMSLTGVALSYGRAGYEFTLADHPITSRGALWVQLLDQAGVPLSSKIYFDTYDSCDRNLIIIDFKQVR
jgi:hypothetical protein